MECDLRNSRCKEREYIRLRFFGQLDAVANGEIYGWAFDADNPLEPVKVALYINRRRAAEALALYFRPDVAEEMNCSGQQGFYFDLARCCDRAGDIIIDVRFPNGQLMDGVPVRVHMPMCDHSSHPTLMFMHIPKTAGTAFREAALAHYKQSEVAYIYRHPPGFPVDLVELPVTQRAHFRFVVGHFRYGFHEWIPNKCSYFAMVRNPVSRVWSQYNHLIEQKDALAFTADGRGRSIEEMLENGTTVELDNMAVRSFSGIQDADFPPGTINQEAYDLAIAHLEQEFVYVGMQERMKEAYESLRKKLGWTRSLTPEIMNVGSYPSANQPDSKQHKLIRHFNKWDIMLYEYVSHRAQAG
jgi:Sulfotransferase family